ncbi:MAG: hypothetical protein HKN09_09840, partial [Saprospiraceae bacterium]|nr:hypothetical protein [Saprospiraceae bacterium]
MNKFITLCLLLCGFCYVTNAQPFYLRGSHGAPCDWGNTNASCELTDPDNDGIYSLNFSAPFTGLYEFKIYDGGTGTWWGGPSGSNAWYASNSGQGILISFDSNLNQIHVAGDLASQSNICAPGDWTVPNWNNATPTNNGCIDVVTPGNYQYKPTYCGTWASWSPIDGTRDMNASNWQLNTLVANQTECFTYNASTGHVLPPPPPQGFYVRGTFACDWNNLNSGCQLEDDGFGNYSVTLDLGPAALGCQEFKIYDASNNLWYPSGANAWFDHVGGEVTFYLDNNNLVGVKDHSNFAICAPGNYTEPMWNNSTPTYSVGGGVYCFTVPVAGSYEWKPTFCGEWKSWEPGSGERSVNAENWTFTTECNNQNVCVRYNPNNGRMEPAFTSAESSGTMACNDHVNVTLNDQCDADIVFSLFVEDDAQIPPPAYSVEITNSVGTVVTSYSDFIGVTLTYTVLDNCSGNTCWGTVTFEDKTPPTVECDCPVGGETGIGDYSEDCTLTCWELPLLKEKYWDRLRDN